MNTMTVTFHHTCNYGAVLQAYALQKTLNKMGHENIIFEYSTNKERKNRNNVISMRGLVRAIISNIHYKLHKKENIALCACGNVHVLFAGCQGRSAYGGASGESRSSFHG